jgi:hypothetical protein
MIRYSRPLGVVRATLFVAVVVGALLLAAGCGRYKAPLPPEVLAPRGVESFTVAGQPNGVLLSWKAPQVDRRGKELKSIEGYLIQRKAIVNRGDETSDDAVYEDLGFIKDKHIEVREKLRAEARAQGKIGRNVQAPEEMTIFSYLDKTAVSGSTYLYQVVPQNQGRTEGLITEVARVVFRGAQSEAYVIDADLAGEDSERLIEAAQ